MRASELSLRPRRTAPGPGPAGSGGLEGSLEASTDGVSTSKPRASLKFLPEACKGLHVSPTRPCPQNPGRALGTVATDAVLTGTADRARGCQGHRDEAPSGFRMLP